MSRDYRWILHGSPDLCASGALLRRFAPRNDGLDLRWRKMELNIVTELPWRQTGFVRWQRSVCMRLLSLPFPKEAMLQRRTSLVNPRPDPSAPVTKSYVTRANGPGAYERNGPPTSRGTVYLDPELRTDASDRGYMSPVRRIRVRASAMRIRSSCSDFLWRAALSFMISSSKLAGLSR